MRAADPTQGAGPVISSFVGIARSSDWIADVGITVHLNKRWTIGQVQTRRILKSPVGRRCIARMLPVEKLVAQIREANDANQRWRKGVRLLRDEVLGSLIGAHRKPGNAGAARRKRLEMGTL